jgi:ferric-dicitrate binding protein FerR (iron transport regulator)
MPVPIKLFVERLFAVLLIALTTTASPPAARAVWVGAEHQVEVGGRIGAPRSVDSFRVIPWLRGQIVFENRPLGEVAAQFNRYGTIAIEIDDLSLRALPISGVFDEYDCDSFAAFLGTLNGVIVQNTTTGIRVRSLAATGREPISAAR